jgi:hypothetical protein
MGEMTRKFSSAGSNMCTDSFSSALTMGLHIRQHLWICPWVCGNRSEFVLENDGVVEVAVLYHQRTLRQYSLVLLSLSYCSMWE